jgi:predicted P-loop ATPase
VTDGVVREDRHVRAHPCPVCGGFDEAPRGQGKRCAGFTSSDGLWCRCTREEFAGSLSPSDAAGITVYRHMMRGECRCGVSHGPALDTQAEATYDYVTPDGTLLFQVVRKPGKKFTQRKPDGAGGWVYSVKGIVRPIYRLPEILTSTGPIYWVEGERDADTLWRRGKPATTSSGGAENFRATKASAIKHLVGREVTILADADDPGRRYASAVASALVDVAVVSGPLECTKGKDISDHLLNGGTLDELVPMQDAKPKDAKRAQPAPSNHGVNDAPVSDWQPRLIYSEKGIKTSGGAGIANASLILAHDPKWKSVLAFDEFAETVVTTAPPPWRTDDAPITVTPGDWTDEDTARLQSYLAVHWSLSVSESVAIPAVKLAAHRRRIHPVKEWLDSLRWDAQRRLPSWLVDIMGCDDSPYTRAVGQAWAISAVARIYQPGCKVDTVLVLEGPPGIFKSSILRALVGDEWFLEMNVTDVSNKDAMQILKRKWIAEFPEIDGLSKAEQSSVKAYFSRQVDTYRASYGKGSRDYKRQAVFAATTNKGEWLVDETGGTGRRMWPVRCRRGDIGLARAIRDQFWAEARARYESGELWHIVDPEIRDAERAEQEKRFRVDPWETPIATWIDHPSRSLTMLENGVTTTEIMSIGGALSIEIGRMTHTDSIRVGSILRRLGWWPRQERRGGVRARVYRKEGPDTHTNAAHDPTSDPLELTESELPGEDSFPPPSRLFD